MNSVPYLAQDEAGKYFSVDGKPFLALGGELHNSSASDLRFMEESVWPSIRKLNGNFYLAAVTWEDIEPREGEFDYTLLDGLIDQARREGVRLGLLWFGVWKCMRSDYLPAWLKDDEERVELMRDEEGQPIYAVSPFCTEVIELSAKTFALLMKHLKEYDGADHTVITVQVENEVGVWSHDRDFSEKANAIFSREIPEDVAALFDVRGTWEEAFEDQACNQFMAWQYAKDIETEVAAGKKEYALSLFYTDKDMATYLNNGIEGENYTKNDDGTISYIDGKSAADSGYGAPSLYWILPGAQISQPLDVNGPTFYPDLIAFNEESEFSKINGFSFNPEAVIDEYTACKAVIEKYRNPLLSGAVDVDETLALARAEMKDAGEDLVIAEKQRQIDEFLGK